MLGWIFQLLPEKLNPFPSFALSPNLFYWCHQITDVTVRMLSKSSSLGFLSLCLGPNFGYCSWGLPSFPSGDLGERLLYISGFAWVTAAMPVACYGPHWPRSKLTDPRTDFLAWPWTCLITVNLSDDQQLNLATVSGLALLVSLRCCSTESLLVRKLPCQPYYHVCLTAIAGRHSADHLSQMLRSGLLQNYLVRFINS